VVGYCRWILPAGADAGLWPEAKVPRVSEEEEERLKTEYDGADWEYDHALDVLDEPQQEIKSRLFGAKNYFREYFPRPP
jgi:hypothetical protein